VTVLDVIQRSTSFLAGKGVESPRRNIEEILAQVLEMPRLNLYLNFEKTLNEAQLETVREMLRRRARREPLQHVLGTAAFCGLTLRCNRDALVPRPETELLAQRARDFLRGLQGENLLALDFGTGSGCLGIMLACEVQSLCVHAVDVSEQALALARANAVSCGVAERMEFLLGDGFLPLPGGTQYDLIVSNPPYIPTAEIDTLEPEVRDHDPRLALDGGPDGLVFYRRLAQEAASWLKPHGRLMIEFGDGHAHAIEEIARRENWIVEAVDADYSHRPRMMVWKRGV
jgi:release factor glutamine methyltransferase